MLGASCPGDTCRGRGIANRLGIKVDQRDDNSVFHFHIAQSMQVRLPTTMLRQIIREAFAHQNVTCVAAIHHPLSQVNSCAGHIIPLVYVGNMIENGQ